LAKRNIREEETSHQSIGSIEELLALDDIESVEVVVPKWNRTVRLREMTKAEHQQLRRDSMRADRSVDIDKYERGLLLVCMEEPAISEEDLSRLMMKSRNAIEFLIGEINRINSFADGSAS
jgi:hypothetical protein